MPWVALGFIHLEFHNRIAAWVQAQQFPPLATCSITELGFVRVLSQAPAYGLTVVQARSAFLRLKKSAVLPFTFIADTHDISHLPAWVKTPKTNHAWSFSRACERKWAVLATLHEEITGSYRISQRAPFICTH